MTFWEKCVSAGCVVVPVKVYSDYGSDGNYDESKFIGIRFAVFDFDNTAVGPEYWFQVDEGQTGLENLYETPEEALKSKL